MKRLKLQIFNSIFKRSLAGRHGAFRRSLMDAQNRQRHYLTRLIRINADTDYGKKHHFSRIGSYREYAQNIPLTDYGMLEPYIEKMKCGGRNVLFSEPLVMFEKSSGSTAPSKYIPYTRSLLNEFHNATSAWLYNIYNTIEPLKCTTAYWWISPKLGRQEYTPDGTKVGFEDDSEYFSRLERIFLKHLLVVDPRLSRLESDQWRRETALKLIADKHLGLVSTWNPSLLILLLEFIDQSRQWLLAQLKKQSASIGKKRTGHIEALFAKDGPIDFEALWPNLKLISCWRDGASAWFFSTLQRYFPNTFIQGKGLLMTEGVVTIPMFELPAPILCVNSHFYEFIEYREGNAPDVGSCPRGLMPHELESGKEYLPVITTGGGLYRYLTGDRVLVKGFYQNVPLLQFQGRYNNVVDLCGEKLNEVFVEKTVELLHRRHQLRPMFAMLAPTLHPKPHYVYYIETNQPIVHMKRLADEFDQALCDNHHYWICRQLGQLAPVELAPVTGGQQSYINTLTTIKHQKYGSIKPKILDSNLFWKEHFTKIDLTTERQDSPKTCDNDYITLER